MRKCTMASSTRQRAWCSGRRSSKWLMSSKACGRRRALPPLGTQQQPQQPRRPRRLWHRNVSRTGSRWSMSRAARRTTTTAVHARRAGLSLLASWTSCRSVIFSLMPRMTRTMASQGLKSGSCQDQRSPSSKHSQSHSCSLRRLSDSRRLRRRRIVVCLVLLLLHKRRHNSNSNSNPRQQQAAPRTV